MTASVSGAFTDAWSYFKAFREAIEHHMATEDQHMAQEILKSGEQPGI
jgi:hypothetical protein